MIFSKKTIRTTSIPKIKKIHSGFWKLKAKKPQNCQFLPKNGQILATNRQILAQNFPGKYTMIFTKKTIRTISIPKIRKIHSGVWKLKAKNLQNCQFWPKNGQILATNGQILAISEFYWHIPYDFLKEDYKGSFHTKNYENL